MPKRKSPQTLVSQCLNTICASIKWFALHHYPQFHCLTSDLIGKIFNRLKTIPGLNASHFQLVVTDHLNSIDLSNPCDQHDSWDFYIDVTLGIIRMRQPNLTRIDLSNVLRIPSIFWTDIVPSLIHLQAISLRSTNCGDQQVLTIVKHCQNLRELDLSLCERVTNWSVSNLCQESTAAIKLQHLDLMQTQVDERGIRSVIERCSRLITLKWRNTINVLGQIYRDRSSSLAQLPSSYSLHQLFSDSSYRLYSIQGAVQLCRHAVQVNIDSPSLLLAEDLQMLKHLLCLRELRVILSNYTRSELLLDFHEGFNLILMKHGSTLQHLSIGRIRNVDLQCIAHYCHELTSLSLELNYNYKYEETSSTSVNTIPSLTKLNVSVRDRESNDVEDSKHDVPSSCLAALVSSPRMKQIKITACHNMDDQILSESVIGRDLESLELESCSNISMRGIWIVIENSNRLSNLNVYRCQLVIDHEIAELSRMIEEKRFDLDVDYYSDS